MGLIDALEAIAVGSVAITNAALEEVGGQVLSFEQWRTVLLLSEADGSLRISALAHRSGIKSPAAARLLGRLARRDLVHLEPDPDDGRATLCCLTDAGRALRLAVFDARRTRLARVLASAGLTGDAGPILDALAAAFHTAY